MNGGDGGDGVLGEIESPPSGGALAHQIWPWNTCDSLGWGSGGRRGVANVIHTATQRVLSEREQRGRSPFHPEMLPDASCLRVFSRGHGVHTSPASSESSSRLSRIQIDKDESVGGCEAARGLPSGARQFPSQSLIALTIARDAFLWRRIESSANL